MRNNTYKTPSYILPALPVINKCLIIRFKDNTLPSCVCKSQTKLPKYSSF